MKKDFSTPRPPRAPQSKPASRRPVPPGPRPASTVRVLLGPLHLALLPVPYGVEMCRRLGEVLLARRLELGISPYELEMRSGVAREMIARFENAECIPGFFNLARLVQALRMDWVEFGRRLMAERAGMCPDSLAL